MVFLVTYKNLKMKQSILIAAIVFINFSLKAQVPGYYNGTENKKGNELKSELHRIIKGHVDFSYSDAKYILNYADEDPNNPNNLIQFYTNRSVSKDAWGTGNDQTNREHIWAKSHGNFADIRPMDGDAHNLHAADASVNILRSNSDFDEVLDGTYIEEADAYYKGEAFEPADRDKGAVARTIFYMAVRYEGTNNELDLEVVDQIDTYPNPTHGKLSTLLEWNRNFPPTEFELRRNNRVFQSQLNRNPFIDHPEFADLIWGTADLPTVSIGALVMNPTHPKAGESVVISATLTSSTDWPTVKLYWGKSYNSETYETDFTGEGQMTATLSLANFLGSETVFLKVVTSSGETMHSTFTVAPSSVITDIKTVQGTGSASPIVNSVVTVAGIVTTNLDNSFYIQNSNNQKQSGLCIYSAWRGQIGDSVAVTGTVVEYQNLTELSDVTMVYNYGPKTINTPLVLSVADLKEEYEGMLVKLKDVSFSNGGALIPADGGSYTIMDGANSITAYVRYNSRLTGHTIPSGTVNVTAVLSQYTGTYQLLIDNIGWIEQGIDITAPVITNVTATDASFIEVAFNEKIKESTISAAAFSIDGLTIDGAYYYPSSSVYLLVSGLQQKEYTLTVNGIEDLYGNVVSNATFNFSSSFGTGLADKGMQSFKVYPNPNKGDFFLTFDEKTLSTKEIKLIDNAGRTIYKEIIPEGINQKHLLLEKTVAKGYYILQVTSLGNISSSKIIIE